MTFLPINTARSKSLFENHDKTLIFGCAIITCNYRTGMPCVFAQIAWNFNLVDHLNVCGNSAMLKNTYRDIIKRNY